MKRRQVPLAIFIHIAAEKNLILTVGWVGLISLKKVKMISGARVAASAVKATANIRDRQKVNAQTKLTNLFGPM